MSKHETDQTRELITKPLKAKLGARLRILKIHSGPFTGKDFVDLMLCLDGRHIEIEVKLWDNRVPTVHQFRALDACYKAGGLAAVIIIEKNKTMSMFVSQFMTHWDELDLIRKTLPVQTAGYLSKLEKTPVPIAAGSTKKSGKKKVKKPKKKGGKRGRK